MNGIYLLLGSNLGDRVKNLREAIRLLEGDSLRILNESSVYETEPWGKEDQGWFLNVVLQIETILEPVELLKHCLSIEESMGRVRKTKWGERKIDVDILYYDNTVMETDLLTLPHPGIPERRFTLIPMCELVPQESHPSLGDTQVELLSKCTDVLDCKQTAFQL